jgi:hypothetical protein
MNKFEQLIEYVINDETDKARALFHDIVVEKSRTIYESMMESEIEDECSIGGDSSDDLIDDVETEEEGINMEGEEEDEEDSEFDDEAEEAGDDLTHDIEDEHDADSDFEGDDYEEGDDLEDRVIDLEDKLDELMSEFEDLMGNGDDGEDFGSDEDEDFGAIGGDELAVDDTESFDDEDGDEEFDDEISISENVKLDTVAKPSNSEESFVNKKTTTAFNSGAIGAQVHPVKMTGDIAKGRSTPSSGDLPDAGQYRNVPGKGTKNSKLTSAPKPVTSQASGVNTRTPFPKG